MISVCMATYNGEKFLKDQLVSILNQLSDSDEVVVSDDGSEDSTIQILESFNDARIKIFHHEKNVVYKINPIKNMNLASQNFGFALSKCTGDVIFLADQDDIWEDDKVSKCSSELKKYELVYHNYAEINEINELTKELHFENEIPVKSSLVQNYLRMPFAGCCMAFNSNLLNSVLPLPYDTITHDQLIGFLALRRGKVKYLKEPLIKRRFHSENSSMYNRGDKFINKVIYTYYIYKSNLSFVIKKIGK